MTPLFSQPHVSPGFENIAPAASDRRHTDSAAQAFRDIYCFSTINKISQAHFMTYQLQKLLNVNPTKCWLLPGYKGHVVWVTWMKLSDLSRNCPLWTRTFFVHFNDGWKVISTTFCGEKKGFNNVCRFKKSLLAFDSRDLCYQWLLRTRPNLIQCADLERLLVGNTYTNHIES